MMRWMLAVVIGLVLGLVQEGKCAERPNVLWIIVDDMSPNFGCYGEKTIQTPEVDALAKSGVQFTRAFVTAPVCSACRSALITGCYQTTIGAHHHRSGRGERKLALSPEIAPLPELMQKAGYFTSIGSWPLNQKQGKTDYNFEWDPHIYNSDDWKDRKPGQPFFAQIQLHGGKHRDGGGLRPVVKKALKTLTDPATVKLPPYYPDDPEIRADWAAYLDSVRYTDMQVGEILARLEQENLRDSTYVFFMTDHGISHARGKQFLYDEGIHVPLIVRGPGMKAGEKRGDLTEHIDLAATTLALAGEKIPDWMQGRNLLLEQTPRKYVFAARDRCDETVDHIRSVRSEEFKYIRNYLPERPLLQPCLYKDDKPTLKRLRELHEAGKLTGLPEQLLFAPKRDAEELYDLRNDPFETKNLAKDPQMKQVLETMRKELTSWEERTHDLGRLPESEAMYDSDMAVYLRGHPQRERLQAHIDQMKRWAKEGK